MEKNIIQVDNKVFSTFQNKVIKLKGDLKKEYPYIKLTNSLVLKAILDFQEHNDTTNDLGVKRCLMNLAREPMSQSKKLAKKI